MKDGSFGKISIKGIWERDADDAVVVDITTATILRKKKEGALKVLAHLSWQNQT